MGHRRPRHGAARASLRRPDERRGLRTGPGPARAASGAASWRTSRRPHSLPSFPIDTPVIFKNNNNKTVGEPGTVSWELITGPAGTASVRSAGREPRARALPALPLAGTQGGGARPPAGGTWPCPRPGRDMQPRVPSRRPPGAGELRWQGLAQRGGKEAEGSGLAPRVRRLPPARWRPAVFCGSRGPQGQAGQCPPLCLLPAPRLHSAERCRCTEHPTNSGRPGLPSGVVLLRGRSGEGGSRQAQRGAQSVCAERPVPGEVPETSHSSTDTPRRPVFWSSTARLHTAVTASVPPSLTDWPDGHHDPGRKASQATSTPGTCHGRAGCSQDPPADATRSPVTLRRGGF